MAIASIGTLGSANNSASATSIALPISAIANANNLVWVIVGCRNNPGGSGNTNVVSLADDSGNTWTKGYEFSITAGTRSGEIVAVFFARISTQINSAANITATFSSACVNRKIAAWEASIGAAPELYGTPQTTSSSTTALGSLTQGSLTSAEYLAIRAASSDDDSGALTVTSSYTNCVSPNINTLGGPDRGALYGEFLIATATSFTSNPSIGAAAETGSILIIIGETGIGGGGPVENALFGGMF